MINDSVRVENSPFDPYLEYKWLTENEQDGAVVTFVGKVRDLHQNIDALILEHYPVMTEKTLYTIIKRARERWALGKVVVIHRVGEVLTNEAIVFVGVSSAHRYEAFCATEFIMDFLKNEAPFWKKEKGKQGEYWIQQKEWDRKHAERWK